MCEKIKGGIDITKIKIMKRLLLTLFLGLNISLYAQESGIKFSNDSLLSDALIQAKKENKLLFVDCYTVWCGPCKYLSSQIFTQKEVGDFYNSHFINISFDMEKPEGAMIKKKYNIIGFPTLLFLDSKGEIVHMFLGANDANFLIELGKRALDNTKNFKALIEKIKKGDRTAETLSSYLNNNPGAIDKDSLMLDYFKSKSAEEKLSQESWNLFLRYVKDIDDPQFQFFIKNREKYESKYGKTATESKLMSGFDFYIYKYKEDTLKYENLKLIDSVLFLKCQKKNEFYSALWTFKKNTTDKVNWDNLIQKTKIYFAMGNITSDDLNDVSWTIYENYKTFNDTLALKLAKEWSYQSISNTTESHSFNDTYGHVLFELGFIEDAIKYETIALQIATKENHSDGIKFYSDEIERFKKAQ